MTPQLQQAIKLLQLSRLELLDTINQELETNPLLEEQLSQDVEDENRAEAQKETVGKEVSEPDEVRVEERVREDVDWENYLAEYNTAWAEAPHDVRELPSIESMTSSKTNLSSHLLWQLNMSNLDEEKREIGFHILGNLDDDGYLKVSLEEISETTGVPVDEVCEVLKFIQQFDPVGVAARDTCECLLIQARFQGLGGTIVERIISEYMHELENKKYERIAKGLSVSLEEVVSAVSVIQGLEPKPGRSFGDDETIYVIPDIYVFKVGDEYEIALN
jgi:RNA polymerase sigma-54 factor